jgi:hypothetical protein
MRRCLAAAEADPRLTPWAALLRAYRGCASQPLRPRQDSANLCSRNLRWHGVSGNARGGEDHDLTAYD